MSICESVDLRISVQNKNSNVLIDGEITSQLLIELLNNLNTDLEFELLYMKEYNKLDLNVLEDD